MTELLSDYQMVFVFDLYYTYIYVVRHVPTWHNYLLLYFNAYNYYMSVIY